MEHRQPVLAPWHPTRMSGAQPVWSCSTWFAGNSSGATGSLTVAASTFTATMVGLSGAGVVANAPQPLLQALPLVLGPQPTH